MVWFGVVVRGFFCACSVWGEGEHSTREIVARMEWRPVSLGGVAPRREGTVGERAAGEKRRVREGTR